MIIDYRARLPLPQIRDNLLEGHVSGYKRVYGKSTDQQDYASWCERPIVDYCRMLDEAGIDKIVFHARDVSTKHAASLKNDVAYEACQTAPNRFLFAASVDPHMGRLALEEMERAIVELGAVEVNFQLFELQLTADDPLLKPFYKRLSELNVPVGLHTGINFANSVPMHFGHPSALDRVAVEFPDLKIIASPPGFPWVLELIAVAWRHPNIFIATGPVRPKYFNKPGTGWEPLMTYCGTVLQDKLLFSTSWPLLPFKRTVDEFRDLPVKPEVLAKWLGGNAARVLNLTPACDK